MIEKFLRETSYIDFSSPCIVSLCSELFKKGMSITQKAQIAYEFVRDEIPHSFDCNVTVITAKASDVLSFKTGICHAKANLLAALLRSREIPTGFCFQHITLAEDDSLGYCVHAYNAVLLENRWIKLDARGNTNGGNAEFSMKEPILAFRNRKEYNEYFWNGIYSSPHLATMKMLESAICLQDIFDNIPDSVDEKPDIED